MLSQEEILNKARRYCAYQERYTKQLRDKLEEWAVPERKKDDIIKQIMDEGYLDDKRYALFYATGKHKTRKWGRIKIKMELQGKGMDASTIQNAIYAIDDELYLSNLKTLLETKLKNLKNEKSSYIKQNKAAQTAMGKGYEGDLVWEALKQIREQEAI